MRLDEVIEEIKQRKGIAGHKPALEVYHLLTNNRAAFLKYLEQDTFNNITGSFENLAYSGPMEHATQRYRDEYEKAFGLLMFYLNKIF